MSSKNFWGLLAVAFVAVYPPIAASDQFIDQTQPVKPDGVIQISNVAGSIRVVSWDKPEVQVKGELEKNVERVDFDVRDGRTSIRVVVGNRVRNNAGADLAVSIPMQSSVDIQAVSADITFEQPAPPEIEGAMLQSVVAKSVSGDVKVAAWASTVELKSVSGNASFSGAAETATIETTSGNIACSGAHSADLRSISGDISAANCQVLKSRTTSGSLTASNVGSDAEVSSISGDVEVTFATMEKVSAQTTSGDIDVQGALAPTGTVSAASQSGDITLGLPPNVSAEFSVKTLSGDVRTDFGVESAGARGGLSFSVGSGGGYVRVSTTSGNVTIEKL